MKKLILTFFYIFFATLIFSQIEFSQIGSIWKYSVNDMGEPSFIQAESVKDTLIQSAVYKKITVTKQQKIYCPAYPNCPFQSYTSSRYELLRISNDTLFSNRFNTVLPVFNYKLKKGDTLFIIQNKYDTLYKLRVNWLSDTLFEGQKQKKWELSEICFTGGTLKPLQYIFIENIGYIVNGFLGFPSLTSCYIVGTRYELCGFENKTIKYSTGCQLVSTKEIYEGKNIHLSPNPAYNSFTILSENTAIKSVKIYDIQGQLVKNVQNTEGVAISIDDLKNGIYFVQLIDNQINIYSKKLIKM